jgi:Domain of unknown function (DUF4440)
LRFITHISRTMVIRSLFVAAVGASTVAACARTRTSNEAETRGLYDRYTDAVRRMDSTAYLSFFTSDFSMRSPDGKVHDPAEMKKYQSINAMTTKKVNSYTVDIESVTPEDDSTFSVIVLQRYDRDQAPLEKPNEPHRIQTSAVQRERWRRTKDGPKIYRIEEIMVGPVLIDGKRQQ